MSSEAEPVIEFACVHCNKRLKAPGKAAGKNVKCPKCGVAILVPSKAAEDDPLRLSINAIDDIESRKAKAEEIQAQAEERRKQLHKYKAVEEQSVHFKAEERRTNDDSDEYQLAPLTTKESRRNPQSTSPSPKPAEPDASSQAAPRSIFDEELPNFSDGNSSLDDGYSLAPVAEKGAKRNAKRTSPQEPVVTTQSGDQTTSFHTPFPLDDLSLEGLTLPPGTFEDTALPIEHEYRTVCPNCGSLKYVKLSEQGSKTKCADCHIQFQVPPPPSGWTPTVKNKSSWGEGDDLQLGTEPTRASGPNKDMRQREAAILQRAEQDVSTTEVQNYDYEFDNASFLRRTFGHLSDLSLLGFTVGYGCVFAIVFALLQYSFNIRDGGFEKGVLVLSFAGSLIIAFIFTAPLLSTALALLESVANGQRKVTEWPGLNLFEQAGELIAVVLALSLCAVPGYFVGHFLGSGFEAAGLWRVSGVLISVFLLFPILYLSILENGSIAEPISANVLGSIAKGPESWGAYYFKNFIMYSCILFAWFMLLGRTPVLSAVAGFLLPFLVYFTFQQLGVLAMDISEDLSFYAAKKKAIEDDNAPPSESEPERTKI